MKGAVLAIPAGRVLRARQRDRATSLPGFDRDFLPQTHEWAIDKLQLKIVGGWRTRTVSGSEFFGQRLSDPDLSWLLRPERRENSIAVETIRCPPLTVGHVKVTATRCNGQNGGVVVEINANPTRTLSALIARFGREPEFRARLFGMDALTFFGLPAETEQIAPSLDGGDNYLPEHPSARVLLGGDAFATFMPIYLAQLRGLIERILSEHLREVSFEGGEQVITSHDGVIRLDWSRAAAPQIETYFERFHRNAEAAVRGAATAILDADTNNRITIYPAYAHQPDLERVADQVRLTATVNVSLDSRHTLSVYAKTPSRIRFEVRRLRRGRYTRVPAAEPVTISSQLDTRLLHIALHVARWDALRLVDWRNLFRFFDEPDVPGISDVTRLMNEIFRAAEGTEEVFRLLIDRLIVDGGISDGADHRIPRTAVARLLRAGVIQKSRIRHRYTPSQTIRYCLVGPYQELRQRILRGLRGTPTQS